MSDQPGTTAPLSNSLAYPESEAEALCRIAARGAGLSWGMSEEAGFAARWLHVRGLEGPKALLALLDRLDQTSPCSVFGNQIRPSRGKFLSPISTGTALSDFVDLLPACIEIGPVHKPVLLLPFLHQKGLAEGKTLSIEWSTGICFVGEDKSLAGDIAELQDLNDSKVVVSTQLAPVSSDAKAVPPPIDQDTLVRLNGYAMRTTVPATSASRTDAGSVEGDND